MAQIGIRIRAIGVVWKYASGTPKKDVLLVTTHQKRWWFLMVSPKWVQGDNQIKCSE